MGMKAAKIVVFDLGKVLLDFDYGKSARALAARSKLTFEQVEKLINHSPLLYRYETGLMSRAEFYGEVRAATGYDGSIEEFGEIFADIFEPIPLMIELQAALRRRGIQTFIFSNTNDLAIGHIRARYPFFGGFDGYVLSYEHGAMKPSAKLYEVVESETGRGGGEIIYLDDRAENVAAGTARGWRAILHETPEKSREAVRAAGMDV
jgi:FMN phosphatase YigB (HAD superfamily)